MTSIDITRLSEIDALQMRYIDALDGKDMSRWLAAFAEDADASYICTSRENVDNGLPLALMLDDCHARLEDRVTYITKIWTGTFQDYKTRHFVQRVNVEAIDDNRVAMRSNFNVLYTPDDSGVSMVLAAGVYEDVVKFTADGPRFLSRKAILDTTILPRYLVYPL